MKGVGIISLIACSLMLLFICSSISTEHLDTKKTFYSDSDSISESKYFDINGTTTNMVSISANGLIAVGTQGYWDSENYHYFNSTIHLFDNGLNALLWSYNFEEGGINELVISNDGSTIIATTGNELMIWDSNSSIPRWSYSTSDGTSSPSGIMISAAISSNGNNITSASDDGEIFYFHKSSPMPIWYSNQINAMTGVAPQLDITTNGEHTIVNSQNSLYLFDNVQGNIIWSYNDESSSRAVKFSGDGTTIIADFSDNFKIFDIASSTPINEIQKEGGQPWPGSISLSFNGEYFAKCDWNSGKISYYNHTSELWSYDIGDGCWEISISSDGSRILANSGGTDKNHGTVYFWNSTSSIPLWTYDYPENQYVGTLELSNDGNHIYIGTQPSGLYYFSCHNCSLKDTDRDLIYDECPSPNVVNNLQNDVMTGVLIALERNATEANTRVLSLSDGYNKINLTVKNDLGTSTSTEIAFSNSNNDAVKFAENIAFSINLAYSDGLINMSAIASGPIVYLSLHNVTHIDVLRPIGTVISDDVIRLKSDFSTNYVSNLPEECLPKDMGDYGDDNSGISDPSPVENFEQTSSLLSLTWQLNAFMFMCLVSVGVILTSDFKS